MLPFVPENGFSTFVLMTDGPREIELWDGEVGQERLQANLPFRLPERLRLGRVAVRRPIEGIPLRTQHPLDPIVVGVQIVPRDGGFTATVQGVPRPVHAFQESGRVVFAYGERAGPPYARGRLPSELHLIAGARR